MIRAGRFLAAAAAFCALSLSAFEWELPGRAWTKVDPPGVWSFCSAPRGKSPAEWRTLEQKDVNTLENRLMFSEADGDAWGVPAVRVQKFQLPGEQILELLTGPSSDPAVVYECMAAGELAYEVTVTDPAPVPGPGADGNAMFRVSRIDAAGREAVLDEFTFRGSSGLIRSGALAVRPGDRIAFRKTATLADDFGRRICRAAVRVALNGVPGRSGLWGAAVPAGRVLLEEYVPVPEREEEGAFRFDFGRTKEKALPAATVRRAGEGIYEITARAEKNGSCAYGSGDIVLLYPVPAAGNYRVEVEAANAGLDVKGGDGGSLSVSILPPGAGSDAAAVFRLAVPASREGEPPRVAGERILKLKADDRVALRLNARVDGYADLFRIRFSVEPAGEEGEEPPAATPESVLPQLTAERCAPGVPMRKGLFWLGADGAWVAGPHTKEAIDLISKFIPELAVIGVTSRPDLLPEPSFFRERGIPALVQNFGVGYEPYWRYMGAFEWDYNGRCHAEKSFVALSGMAHAAALPHPAVREAFDRLVRASVRRGYTGCGFNDMVWHWGPGRGASGYNPETLRAFRQSLKGEDEGFLLGWGNRAPRRWFFRDYVRYYLGAEPRPENFGFKSWDGYRPLLKPEADARRKAGKDVTAEGMLLDLLVHYEWLKAADRLGCAAKEEGGFFQVLPNPEDLANGNDFLFLAGLANVGGRTEEYFQSPLFMNGAYFRFPYFRDRTSGDTETGVVLEAGAGGNGAPYYTAEMSLKLAYEITLATRADHLEGDFWWGFDRSPAECAQEELVRNRYGAILAYGLGFRYAREDGRFERLAPDFVSITSRRLFRPWGTRYCPWNWRLDTEFSPDRNLARLGYVFSGQGEESLQEPEFRAGTVFFSASPATESGWRNFMALLESGRIANGVVMAGALRRRIGGSMRPEPFLELREAGAASGALKDAAGVVLAENVSIRKLYEPPAGYETEFSVGGRPVVVSRRAGKGKLWMLLFTPVPETAEGRSGDAAAGDAVYRALPAKLGVSPHWESRDPVEARLYRAPDGTLLVSAMRHDRLAETADGGVYPADAPGGASLRLRLEPGREYGFVTFPELRRGVVKAGADGMTRLDLGRSSYELFYVVSAEGADALAEKCAARAAEFRRAMTLDGQLEIPAR